MRSGSLQLIGVFAAGKISFSLLLGYSKPDNPKGSPLVPLGYCTTSRGGSRVCGLGDFARLPQTPDFVSRVLREIFFKDMIEKP